MPQIVDAKFLAWWVDDIKMFLLCIPCLCSDIVNYPYSLIVKQFACDAMKVAQHEEKTCPPSTIIDLGLQAPGWCCL